MNILSIPRNEQGYLLNSSDWNNSIAEIIAAEENITLSTVHWEIIQLLRQYYQAFQLIPPLRIFVKVVAKELGLTIGNSLTLHELFPEGVLKQACKIAGLPKPRHCL